MMSEQVKQVMRHSMLTLGAAGVLTLAPSMVDASVIYDSNGFEAPTFTTGNLHGQGNWSNGTGSPGDIVIQTSTVHAGSQAIQITDPGSRQLARYDRTTAVTQDHYVDFWVIPPHDAGNELRLRLRDGNNDIVVQVIFQNNGRLGNDPATYNIGQWNRVTVSVQPMAATYGVSINGALAYQNQAMRDVNGADPGGIGGDGTIDRYGFDLSGGAFVDDFRITTTNPIPEPGSMALLLTAGAALLARRRR